MNTLKKTNFVTIIFLTVCIVGLCVVAAVMPLNNAFAQTLTDDEFDLQFKQTAQELDIGLIGNIIVEKSAVYDAELAALGYEYEFVSEGSRGYMIIIDDITDDCVKVSEIVVDAESPYNNIEGMPVYLTELNYASYVDGVYDIINEDKQLVYEQVEDIYGKRYHASARANVTTEKKVTYSSRAVDKYELAKRIPSYVAVGLTGACVPLAGGNIVAYFDRYCENLIPDYTPGSTIGSFYLYKTQSEVISNLIETLYYAMNPSSSEGGHTISGFKSGLNTYCKDRGYSVTYSECASGGKINYSTAKTKLKAGLPIIMFVDDVEYVSIQEYDGYDDLYTYYMTDVAHAMTAFGYKEITYTYNSGITEKVDYLYLATGFGSTPTAYMNINNRMTVDNAYAINIS